MPRFSFRPAAVALALALCAASVRAEEAPKPYLSLAELRAKYADPAGHIAKIDGVEVYYKDEGAGPVLLMVHGSVSTLKTWDRIVAKLKDRYRIIRYDIPPQGLSGPVSDEAAARLKPADVAEQLLDQLGVKHVTYVGVSSGGTLGIFLAAKRPNLVDRLILSNTPSDPVDTSHLVSPPAWAEAQRKAKETKFQDQVFWNEFLSYFSGDPARIDARTRSEYYDFNRRVPEKYPITLVAQVANHQRALEAMAAVRAPTLLVWGGRDPLLTPPTADILAGYLTGTQISKVFMPDVGHYPPLEAPERFAQIIAAYIEAATPAVTAPSKK